jgi:hypothetical protein
MSGWLIGIQRQARREIRRIMETEGKGWRWWVRVTPSVGRARDVTLILKGRPDREWEIMVNGHVLDPVVETPQAWTPGDRRAKPVLSVRSADGKRRRGTLSKL